MDRTKSWGLKKQSSRYHKTLNHFFRNYSFSFLRLADQMNNSWKKKKIDSTSITNSFGPLTYNRKMNNWPNTMFLHTGLMFCHRRRRNTWNSGCNTWKSYANHALFHNLYGKILKIFSETIPQQRNSHSIKENTTRKARQNALILLRHITENNSWQLSKYAYYVNRISNRAIHLHIVLICNHPWSTISGIMPLIPHSPKIYF